MLTSTLTQRLFETVAALPLVCPHGHVDPRLFRDPDYSFGTPTELFLLPDHYLFRMLYSQGISLATLGIPARTPAPLTEDDHRRIWRIFCEHFKLFRATPSGWWLHCELADVFGVRETPTAENADRLYDTLLTQLTKPEFRPRALYERFGIEVLCTTDAATDTLEHHQAIRESGWSGRILPTFRPDALMRIDKPDWKTHVETLAAQTNRNITTFAVFREAIAERRAFFQTMGATATDHAALTADTEPLSVSEAEAIFERGLRGQVSGEDAARFTANFLWEMARMSLDDGLVMQLHVGAFRDHNPAIFDEYGSDKGADIPVATEFTRALRPLLSAFGNEPGLTLILFTLDESTYARELAPLAGHYPALRLGPPWWFHDSRNGMVRYLDNVLETAGLYNLAGFNDDTRAFCSIPARHELWRHVTCHYLAGLVTEKIITEEDAADMAQELAVGLARRAYRLD